MDVKIFDQNGTQRDWAWLKAKYGNVAIMQPTVTDGKATLAVAELREKEGPATLVVHVQDEAGQRLSGVNCIFFWPDAPLLPMYDPPPERWKDRGVYGPSNDAGDVGFGMGAGAYYDPKVQEGPHAVFTGRPNTHTDLVTGLGMLPNTVHAHLDVIFQLVPAGEPEPPIPPDPGEMTAFEAALILESQAWRALVEAHWRHEGDL